jgi:hypothetical protein
LQGGPAFGDIFNVGHTTNAGADTDPNVTAVDQAPAEVRDVGLWCLSFSLILKFPKPIVREEAIEGPG